jgi:hypothetical protein
MNHFDIWQWADYVRGLGQVALHSTMERHLASGCRRCQNTVDLLREIASAASADAAYAPPDHAVRYAVALYSTVNHPGPGLLRLVAHLVYDSAREPLPVGLRSQDRLLRRAVYVAGDLHVDLQLKRQPAKDVITLVGQLAASGQSVSVADVPIWLMERERLVEATTCDAFGEFSFEYDARRNLQVFVPLRDIGKRLEIPLDQLTPGGASTSRPGVARQKASSRRIKTREF